MLTTLFTFIAGSTLAWLVRAFFARHDSTIALINDYLLDLEKIEKLSIEYWSQGTTDPENEMETIRAQLLGAVTASSYFETSAKEILKSYHSDYTELDEDLFRLTTGGEFYSAVRAPDYDRIVDIMVTINQLRSLLCKSRRNLLWAH